jgi:alpha-L-fucosidase 2
MLAVLRLPLLLALHILVSFPAFSQQKADLVLWYDHPAKDWNEALPIGNGRLGAMIFGRAANELIQLNEQTLWTGGPANLNPNPDAPNYLQPVRDALFSDSIGKAVKLLHKMQGPNTNMYQPLGDIIIRQPVSGEVTDYYRDLDLSNATATTRFTAEGVTYSREVFSSAPDQVMMIRLKASRPGALQFTVDVQNALQYRKSVDGNKELILKGKARIYSDENGNIRPILFEDSEQCDGMRFQFRIKAVSADGTIGHTDSSLVISGATEVLLYVSGATSFNGFDKCPDKEGKDEAKIAGDFLQAALKRSYAQLLAAHIKDYKKYFDRVTLFLNAGPAPASATRPTPGPAPSGSGLPTDQRLAEYRKGAADPRLEALYFQFGRYLLISSSRPGGLPANLQGIWNKEIRPPWRSNYTTNINLQMNYWPAEVCNLSEMTEPLIQHIQRLAINGKATARNYYHANGWAVHHNTDIWAQTNPVGEGGGDPKWANWALGSPWLSQHLYEHYRFTGDKRFLKDTAYPLMKGAAEFCLDWLVSKDGYLVTAPSTSPENVYILPNGTKGTVTIASAMDMEIIWDLFSNLIDASAILGTDQAFAALLRQKRSLLSPLKIGRKGNLEEWYGDWEDEDPQHRHVSHLFGLHPGHEISPLIDTAFANAARKTLEIRGDGGTGWSKAWKINFWARLLDGNHAYKMYQELLKASTMNNLFDTHPPFQIDGNFGATAGIAEMMLQSHLDEIQLLPALPAAWSGGHVKGLVARGGFEIEMFWSKGRLTRALITSRAGQVCKIHNRQPFPTIAGKTYELRFNK